jgi:hypothetical protein
MPSEVSEKASREPEAISYPLVISTNRGCDLCGPGGTSYVRCQPVRLQSSKWARASACYAIVPCFAAARKSLTDLDSSIGPALLVAVGKLIKEQPDQSPCLECWGLQWCVTRNDKGAQTPHRGMTSFWYMRNIK